MYCIWTVKTCGHMQSFYLKKLNTLYILGIAKSYSVISIIISCLKGKLLLMSLLSESCYY